MKIAVLASGRGSNFQSIIDAIEAGRIKGAEIDLLVVDNPGAPALERADKHLIDSLYLNPEDFITKDAFYSRIADELKARKIGLVILAGFMRVVGRPLLEAFPMQVINIHPAILPSFPGLHGQKQAADYGVKLSGCTVHFVDEGVDTGPVIIQAAVPVLDGDTEDTLSERILKYEHIIFPEAVRLFVEGRLEVKGRKVRIKDAGIQDVALINPPMQLQ